MNVYINVNFIRTYLDIGEIAVERISIWILHVQIWLETGVERLPMWFLYAPIFLDIWKDWRLTFYINMNLARTNLLEETGVECLLQCEFYTRTNFLRQLKRLKMNILYQYESYMYKFFGDGLNVYRKINFIQTSTETCQFFQRLGLGLNVFINMNK